MDSRRIEYWPGCLQSVFRAVGSSMGDRRLAPGMLDSIPADRGKLVAGHRVSIGYMNGKRPGPRSGHYIVTIEGPHINACWRFRPIELERLAREVTHTLARSHGPVGRYEVGVEVW
ncbi:MAG TPA: hypothetical protein VKT30_10450 [Caulobacteraceae bacterium]|nr:hypothetical protein [Caulobacteraceae bacterium]